MQIRRAPSPRIGARSARGGDAIKKVGCQPLINAALGERMSRFAAGSRRRTGEWAALQAASGLP